MSTIGRAPKDYNAGAWGRIVARIDKAINTLTKRLEAGENATRQLQREQRASGSANVVPDNILTSTSSISDNQLSGNIPIKTNIGGGSSITADTIITIEINGDPYYILAEAG